MTLIAGGIRTNEPEGPEEKEEKLLLLLLGGDF